MAEEFVDDRNFSQTSQSDRESVRVILVGSKQGIVNLIHTLYVLNFAQICEWSELTPEPNSDRFMSVLTKHVSLM